MRKLMLMALAWISFMTPAFGGWHTITPVTMVSMMGWGGVYVKGGNPSGYACTDMYGYYGTLYADGTSMKEMYALALTAYTLNKGLMCYVYTQDANGMCKMENCHIQ